MTKDKMTKEKIMAAKTKAAAKARAKAAKWKKTQAKRMKRQRKLWFVLGAGSTCLVLGGALVMIFPVVDYGKGRILLAQKDYMKAEQVFAKCKDFLDSRKQYDQARYEGAAAFLRGDQDEMLSDEGLQSAYAAIIEVTGSEETAKQVCYDAAKKRFEKARKTKSPDLYTAVFDLYDRIGDYLDTKECRRVVLYCYGEDCYDNKQYQYAYHAFVECGDYRDSASRAEAIKQAGLVNG